MKSYFSFTLNLGEDYVVVIVVILVEESENDGRRWKKEKMIKERESFGEEWR